LLHFHRGGRVRLGPGIIDRRGDQVLDHRLLAWREQAFVQLDRENAPLGRRPDLYQPAAGRTLNFNLVEIVLRLLKLVLRILRHFHDFVEVGHFGHVRRLSS
jgi:hypothetical protein